MSETADDGRRRFLGAAAAAVVGTIASPALAAIRLPLRRSLSFHHLHTGEALNIVYWADGRYQPGALNEINWLLRDFRNDTVHPIDPRLLDLLTAMRQHLHTSAPFQVISGYRSPETNAMLAATTEGVATNSLHLRGQAIDIRIAGRHLAAVRRVAVALRRGGVGYYPHSDFVHVDVGRVRYW